MVIQVCEIKKDDYDQLIMGESQPIPYDIILIFGNQIPTEIEVRHLSSKEGIQYERRIIYYGQ
nr:hypothetical protein [Halovivax sp. KZCA124]